MNATIAGGATTYDHSVEAGPRAGYKQAIRAGAFRSVDEFMDAAIAILTNLPAADASAAPRKSRLWDLREGLSLGDLTIKELIEEGRE